MVPRSGRPALGASDWGLCLARTNWDVPKHPGSSVFIFPIRQPSIEVHRIEMLNGSREFCQVPHRPPSAHSDRIGAIDDGWTVGTRWMFHERMLTNSPHVTIPVGYGHGGNAISSSIGVAARRRAGRISDPSAWDLIGSSRAGHR